MKFKKNVKIIITKNGPYLVTGRLELKKEIIHIGKDGEPDKWISGDKYPDQETYLLCRCGQSKNKPYCDNTHLKIKFDGTEKASRKKYRQLAENIEGPKLKLSDAVSLCAHGRFCNRAGGTWNLVQNSDKPLNKKTAIQETGDCPAGRLVVWDRKTNKAIEPKFNKLLSLVEDPQERSSGPIWVKGEVTIESANGYQYETRNRVTLCRCGKSNNKPFCDGVHSLIQFNDGDKSIN